MRRALLVALVCGLCSAVFGQVIVVKNVAIVPGVTAKGQKSQRSFNVNYRLANAERRLLAVELDPAGAKALKAGGSLTATTSLTGKTADADGYVPGARLALILWDADGYAWYTVGDRLRTDEAQRSVSLADLKPTAFTPQDHQVNLTEIQRLWLGVVLDGPAEGQWTVSNPTASATPYRASDPYVVPLDGDWNVGAEPAVKKSSKVVAEGPNGTPALRIDATFPEARHMYLLFNKGLRADDLVGYNKLRITYRAQLRGDVKLLLGFTEAGGAQYLVDPWPASSDAWQTIEVPLTALKMGSWCQDASGRLELTTGAQAVIGCHGTANPPGPMTIWVSRFELLP